MLTIPYNHEGHEAHEVFLFQPFVSFALFVVNGNFAR